MVFHTIGSTTYLYISETNQIDRFLYKQGDTTAHDKEVVVSNLPSGGNHPLKNIALDTNDKLYVALGSSCNACAKDTTSNPQRAAIYQYDADGKNGRLFARGLRNAEGLAFVPGTNTLWVVVNNRDNIPYPTKDSSGNYGQVVPDYVDNHPPDEFIQVRDGGNYGWPFCNPNPDSSTKLDNMPFDLDYENNRDGKVNCDKMDRVNKGIQAHTAPLGVIFLQDTKFAEAYRQGAVVALHGSWNRTMPIGYKVVYYPWNADKPGDAMDLVSGWLDNSEVWGRPVDIAVDPTGNLFISDDQSGTIYKLMLQS
jgi:glucose/arabinose dehydrogenase